MLICLQTRDNDSPTVVLQSETYDLVSDWGLAVSFTATASNHTQQVVQY